MQNQDAGFRIRKFALWRGGDYLRLARFTRNCVSRGTGRPVAPFSRPLFHAAPAKSWCAHLNFFAKRARNHAPLTLPAGRPVPLHTQFLVPRDFAREAGIPTPVLDTVSALVKAKARLAGCYDG